MIEGPITLEVRLDGRRFAAVLDRESKAACGPLEVELSRAPDGFSWSVANASGHPVEVFSVSAIWDGGPAAEPVRAFRNGYQSWSRAGRVVLGETVDPSRHPGSIDLVRAMHHADPAPAEEGVVRSDLVALADRAGDRLVCVGFEGAAEHDSVVLLQLAEGRLRIRAEAYLGGARFGPSESRDLHRVIAEEGDSHGPLLERWARRAGKAGDARTSSPYQVGWCSWYQYFHSVDEEAIRSNLVRAAEWPFGVFQIDDGYQRAIGDWLTTNDKFQSGLEDLASAIDKQGLTSGIWIAPFLASPDSNLVGAHPEFLALYGDGSHPLVGMVNAGWGGLVHTLDTTRPEVIDHLEKTAAALVGAGFTYLKLDFTYAPSIPGIYADPTRTPAQRVRAGLEAIRRGAGPETFLLGCGCPLGQGIGLVDGMRIGPDVAPFWGTDGNSFVPPGYDAESPSIQNAWRNTLARSFMHRTLWLNDPDCLMLRNTQTYLTREQARAWARVVGGSGGMALVSDDLSLLGPRERALLHEVLELGSDADERSRQEHPPRCDDLLQRDVPYELDGTSYRFW